MRSRKASAIVAAAVALAGGAAVITSSPGAAAAPRALPPGPMYGVTVDDVSNVSQIVAGNDALPVMPTTRVVLDPGPKASYYRKPIEQIRTNSYVLAELLDSAEMKRTTLAAEKTRVDSMIAALGDVVDLWEVGNEVNGKWTGDYATGGQMIAQTYDQVVAAGGKTAITVWYNDGCKDTGEADPFEYATKYLPARVRNGLDYVLLSYYQTQCQNVYLSQASVKQYMEKLHAVFPNSLVGFGEIGLPDPVTSGTRATALKMIDHYYRMPIDLPYYVGGYFWWYYYEDALPHAGNTIWNALAAAMPHVSGGGATPSTTSTTAPATTSTTAPTTTTTAAPTTTTTAPPAPAPAPAVSSPTPFSSMAKATWREGDVRKGWVTAWTGYGKVGIVDGAGSKVLAMAPKTATTPDATHSSLVRTRSAYANPTFTVPMRTVKQLRQGSTPNPWETSWVMWNYTSNTSYYAVVLKPNGWEVSRGDAGYPGAQHFLGSGTLPTFPVGTWYRIGIRQEGNQITVLVNGEALGTVTDPTPTGPLGTGSIGLYTEDAAVRFGDVKVTG